MKLVITTNPNRRSGQPCIGITRMTVKDVIQYLDSGMSPEQIVQDFPDQLDMDDVVIIGMILTISRGQ